ncbi:hypothetical protein [Mesorhizobium sophorae]|uniref:hypothetical protein n=1 Tax=Mesorhizobium sophorae TaxID=1300294 RepID=UPI00117F43C3|nr:hypothetical protein [Mesorhizobium sophorae]
MAAVAVGLAVMALTVGTPHDLNKVRCIADRHENCEFYLECEYFGIDGRWKVTPDMMPNFQCPEVMFFGLSGPAVVNHPSEWWLKMHPEDAPGASARDGERRGS